jgi:hypothetical protein
MKQLIEYAYTAPNGARFKISDDGGCEQWRCLECWEFGHVGHEEDIVDAEFQAQQRANDHALHCQARGERPKRANLLATAPS